MTRCWMGTADLEYCLLAVRNGRILDRDTRRDTHAIYTFGKSVDKGERGRSESGSRRYSDGCEARCCSNFVQPNRWF